MKKMFCVLVLFIMACFTSSPPVLAQTPVFDASSDDFSDTDFVHAYPGMTRTYSGTGYLDGFVMQMVYESEVCFGVACLKSTLLIYDTSNPSLAASSIIELAAKDTSGRYWMFKFVIDGFVEFEAASLSEISNFLDEPYLEARLIAGSYYTGQTITDSYGIVTTIISTNAVLGQYPGHEFVVLKVIEPTYGIATYFYYDKYVGGMALYLLENSLSSGGMILNGFDVDKDGLPDEWERRYFSGSIAPSGTQDSDLDGLNNKQEYDLGLNPQDDDTDDDGMKDGPEVHAGMDAADPHSLFALSGITGGVAGSGIKLTWNASDQADRHYSIFWKDSASDAWNQVDYAGWQNDIIVNPDGSRSWTDTGIDRDMFTAPPYTPLRLYKIVVQNVQ